MLRFCQKVKINYLNIKSQLLKFCISQIFQGQVSNLKPFAGHDVQRVSRTMTNASRYQSLIVDIVGETEDMTLGDFASLNVDVEFHSEL